MDFFHEMMDVVKQTYTVNYANFSGRARRREFWTFWLFTVLVASILGIVGGDSGFFAWLARLFSIVNIVPNLAFAWRRLHDIGKSGGYWFFCLIPLVGWIFLLVWFVREGDRGPNMYGDDPKGYRY